MEEPAARQEWFRTIFEMHFVPVQAYCMRRLRAADANDAAAEVFAIVWRKSGDLPEADAVRSWLYGIARNVIRHSYRSSARQTQLSAKLRGLAMASPPSPEMQVVRRSEDEELVRALLTLREPDREILRLRMWEELSAPQVAEVLDISVAAAEKRASRALGRLERALKAGRLTRPNSRGGES